MRKVFIVIATLYSVIVLGILTPALFAQSTGSSKMEPAPPVVPSEATGPIQPEIREGYVLFGDMILPEQAVNGVSAQGLVKIWPWPDGIIPYIFDEDVTDLNRERMVTAMAVWEDVAYVD
ncbi:MAG: hypothetical protein AAF787_23475, partial [Chloroflexota bacterium]